MTTSTSGMNSGDERELIELLGAYGDAKFGDEWWPGNPGPWLPQEQAIRLAELTNSPIPQYDEDGCYIG